MSESLRHVIINYRNEPLSGDKVHVVGRKNGKIVFDGYYQIYGSIETNYSRLAILWPEDGILPAEYQDHYGSSRYPVEIKYFEEEDKVHLSGKYFNKPYEVVVQLPPKRTF